MTGAKVRIYGHRFDTARSQSSRPSEAKGLSPRLAYWTASEQHVEAVLVKIRTFAVISDHRRSQTSMFRRPATLDPAGESPRRRSLRLQGPRNFRASCKADIEVTAPPRSVKALSLDRRQFDELYAARSRDSRRHSARPRRGGPRPTSSSNRISSSPRHARTVQRRFRLRIALRRTAFSATVGGPHRLVTQVGAALESARPRRRSGSRSFASTMSSSSGGSSRDGLPLLSLACFLHSAVAPRTQSPSTISA